MSLSCIKTELFRSQVLDCGQASVWRTFAVCFLAVGCTLAAAKVTGEPVVVDDFEGPQIRWQIGPSDTAFKILSHQRVHSPVHSGSWSESIRLVGQGGSFVYATLEIGRAHVIDELAFSVWLRSDRSGLQLAARVVLPRTQDPQTGKPLTMRIYGEQYQDVGSWQQISLHSIAQRVMRQARIVRSGDGMDVDPREAYVDRLLINVYGGQGTTNVWIDDLEIRGFIGQQVDSEIAATGKPERNRETTSSKKHAVQFRESQLMVDGKPFFPLVVQYQGEPFAFLKSKGFNTIWLPQPPTADQRIQAKKNDLWILSPPFLAPVNVDSKSTKNKLFEKRNSHPFVRDGELAATEPMLAWYFGHHANEERALPGSRDRITEPAAKPRLQRPGVGDVHQKIGAQPCDITLLQRDPLGTSLEMADYADWLQKHTGGRNGRTVCWNALPTQRSRSRTELPPPNESPSLKLTPPGESLPYTQLRTLVMESLMAGVRGLIFLSESPLNETTPQAKQRAAALELINLELSPVQSLLASSQSPLPVRCLPANVAATSVQLDRVHLVLSNVRAEGSQYVGKPLSERTATFVVPGIPTSARAFVLSPLGLKTISRERIAGGTRLTLPGVDCTSILLLTDDRQMISRTAQRLTKSRNRATSLFAEVVRAELESLKNINRRLQPLVQTAAVARQQSQAEDLRQRADHALREGNNRHAYSLDRAAQKHIHTAQRRLWEDAVQQLGPPTRLSSLARFETLPDAYEWTRFASQARLSKNLVSAGKMETMEEFRSAGWQTVFSDQREGEATADIISTKPHGGDACMQIHLRCPPKSPGWQEIPSLTVVSPEIEVTAGRFYEIRVWVRTAGLRREKQAQLLVFDSIGGLKLATHIQHAPHWEPITVYRKATHHRPLKISISLQGSGDVWIDDVTVRQLDSPVTPLQRRDAVLANPQPANQE